MFHFLPYLPQINLFGYEIPTIPVLTLACVIAYFLIVTFEAKRLKLNLQASILIFFLAFLLYNIFGRILFTTSHIFLHQDFSYQNKLFGLYTNQKVAFGFLIAQFLAVVIGVYVYEKKDDLKKYFDIVFLACTSLFFIRIGGALTHYPIGKITNSFWGNYYFKNYRHEPALYEAISLMLIFIIALFIRKKIKTPGFLALIILAWISFSRIITDFFRGNDLPLKSLSSPTFEGADVSSNFHFKNGLTLNQLAYSVLFVYALITIFFTVRRRREKKDEKTSLETLK